jgi:hypothetical protein
MADQFEPGTDFVAWACRIAYLRVLRQWSAAKQLRIQLNDAVMGTVVMEMLDANRLDSLVAAEDFSRRQQALIKCLDELPERYGAVRECPAEQSSRCLWLPDVRRQRAVLRRHRRLSDGVPVGHEGRPRNRIAAVSKRRHSCMEARGVSREVVDGSLCVGVT